MHRQSSSVTCAEVSDVAARAVPIVASMGNLLSQAGFKTAQKCDYDPLSHTNAKHMPIEARGECWCPLSKHVVQRRELRVLTSAHAASGSPSDVRSSDCSVLFVSCAPAPVRITLSDRKVQRVRGRNLSSACLSGFVSPEAQHASPVCMQGADGHRYRQGPCVDSEDTSVTARHATKGAGSNMYKRIVADCATSRFQPVGACYQVPCAGACYPVPCAAAFSAAQQLSLLCSKSCCPSAARKLWSSCCETARRIERCWR